MWRANLAAGRPWPTLSEDSVLDFMIMEAVSLKIRKEDREAEKARERERFKKDHSSLDQFR